MISELSASFKHYVEGALPVGRQKQSFGDLLWYHLLSAAHLPISPYAFHQGHEQRQEMETLCHPFS